PGVIPQSQAAPLAVRIMTALPLLAMRLSPVFHDLRAAALWPRPCSHSHRPSSFRGLSPEPTLSLSTILVHHQRSCVGDIIRMSRWHGKDREGLNTQVGASKPG